MGLRRDRTPCPHWPCPSEDTSGDDLHQGPELQWREGGTLPPRVHTQDLGPGKEMPLVNMKEIVTERKSKTSKEFAFPYTQHGGAGLSRPDELSSSPKKPNGSIVIETQ